MAIDLNHSRRKTPFKCRYWHRNEKATKDLSQLIYETKPAGVFYAREVNTFNYQQSQAAGVFMYDKTSVQLYTEDEIKDLKQNDIVEFRNNTWFVTDIQKKTHAKEAWFSKSPCNATYLSLRK